jgi:hypothetical protein
LEASGSGAALDRPPETGRRAAGGLIWVVVLIALDLAHYVMVSFDGGTYFVTVAPSYILIPIITTSTMG